MIHDVVVHRNKNLARLDAVGHKCFRTDGTALGLDNDAVVWLDAVLLRIRRIDFDVDMSRYWSGANCLGSAA